MPFPCHPDRSVAERRDLRFLFVLKQTQTRLVESFFGTAKAVPFVYVFRRLLRCLRENPRQASP
jgi:hypothetical protein